MSNQNTKDCCGNTIYNAEEDASGIALTYRDNIVKANASATASSTVSYNDARNIAYNNSTQITSNITNVCDVIVVSAKSLTGTATVLSSLSWTESY